MATISFGVVTEATTAAEAMQMNATRMNQVMAALRRAGIEARDVQTSGLNLSAQYDYVQNEPPRLRGYQANNRVTVIINDLNAVGTTADAVVAAGVNQIDGISFGLKDPTAAENRARQLAVRNLQAKAFALCPGPWRPAGRHPLAVGRRRLFAPAADADVRPRRNGDGLRRARRRSPAAS
jgi:uncharacterized protein YggE